MLTDDSSTLRVESPNAGGLWALEMLMEETPEMKIPSRELPSPREFENL